MIGRRHGLWRYCGRENIEKVYRTVYRISGRKRYEKYKQMGNAGESVRKLKIGNPRLDDGASQRRKVESCEKAEDSCPEREKT